ncbi:serine/threonine protein phosphatase [Rubrivivax gelatinosus]|nr:serine/threonine protein phosphatase [Rubrivivax gelatinosus]
MIRIRMAGCSEQGARSENEDAFVIGHARNGHFAVLADGAGGHRRGAEAAQRAVACIERLLRDDAVAFSPDNLTQMVRLAHDELLNHQDGDSPQQRMHCTVVVLWIDPAEGHVLWTHVGDSRLYRLRHGRVDVVTSDDSVVQRMVQAGVISAGQAREHPQRNQLLAALGMVGELAPHTVVRPVELLEGDAFLLCTDGWWDAFEHEALERSLARSLDPQRWLEDLRDQVAARRKPRQDNFSAVAVWVGDPAEASPAGDEDTRPRRAAA